MPKPKIRSMQDYLDSFTSPCISLLVLPDGRFQPYTREDLDKLIALEQIPADPIAGIYDICQYDALVESASVAGYWVETIEEPNA